MRVNYLYIILALSNYARAEDEAVKPSRKEIVAPTTKHVAFPQPYLDLNGKVHILYTEGDSHYGHNNNRVVKKVSSTSSNGWTFLPPKTLFSDPISGVSVESLGVATDSNNNPKVYAAITSREYKKEGDAYITKSSTHKLYSSSLKDIDKFDTDKTYPIRIFPFGNIFRNNEDLFVSGYLGSPLKEEDRNGAGAQLVNEKTGKISYIKTSLESPDKTWSPTETSLVQVGNDKILAFTRVMRDLNKDGDYVDFNEDYYLYQQTSTDAGKTWSLPKYLFRGGPAHATMLKNGNIILCYTFRVSAILTNEKGGIYCSRSKDKGNTWSTSRPLYNNNMYWDFGYARTLELNDGNLFSVYYSNNGDKENTQYSIQRAIWKEEYLSNDFINPNLLENGWFSEFTNSVHDLKGNKKELISKYWEGIPSGGAVKFSSGNTQDEVLTRKNTYKNGNYLNVEVLEKGNYPGISQLQSDIYTKDRYGSSMDFSFLGHSKYGNKIYVDISLLKTDGSLHRVIQSTFELNNDWKLYQFNFDLPFEVQDIKEGKILTTIGFAKDEAKNQHFGIDNIVFEQRQKKD